MKRRDFLVAGMAGLVPCLPFQAGRAWAEAGKARPLPRYRPDHMDTGFLVEEAGDYFLSRDTFSHTPWTIHGMYFRTPSDMLQIRSSDVDIDLREYTLGGDSNTHGIHIVSATPRMVAEEHYSPRLLDLRRVRIRNGTIDQVRGDSAGMGIRAMREWQPRQSTGDRYEIQNVVPGPERRVWVSSRSPASSPPPLLPNAFPGYESKRYLEWGTDGYVMEIVRVPKPQLDYIRCDYLFENLTIKTPTIAVAVEGSHVTLRNCTIDSAGLAALIVAGPNVTIENCTIRLRKQCSKSVLGERAAMTNFPKLPDEVLMPPRAAIVLRDGTNAVIRNNRIWVDQAEPIRDGCEDYEWRDIKLTICPGNRRNECILVQDGAKNVVVEGNTFINFEGDPVKLSAGAEATVRDNKMERRWISF